MKIGLVCPYNMLKGGGVQECVLALQKELTGRGHKVHIITPQPRDYKDGPPRGIVFAGVATAVRSFHTTSQISASAKIQELDALLHTYQFDILHFHEPWVPLLSRQLLSRSQSVNLATFHAKLPETIMNRTIEKAVMPYTRSVTKYLDGLTAVSDAAAEYVRSVVDRPITIIPNGIDLKKYKHVKKPSGKNKTILFIGRLEKRKGLKYLLKAYSLLTDKNIRLIIAGEGPERSRLEAFAQEKQLSKVVFRGFVTEKQKLELLQSADVFCSPALYGESFGIVLLEAMASGLVTVAGNNPGYTTVLKEKGALSLINPKDTKEFARRLELLLHDEELKNVWRKWAAKYVRQFDYPKIVDQYERLYAELLRIKRKQRT